MRVTARVHFYARTCTLQFFFSFLFLFFYTPPEVATFRRDHKLPFRAGEILRNNAMFGCVGCREPKSIVAHIIRFCALAERTFKAKTCRGRGLQNLRPFFCNDDWVIGRRQPPDAQAGCIDAPIPWDTQHALAGDRSEHWPADGGAAGIEPSHVGARVSTSFLYILFYL